MKHKMPSQTEILKSVRKPMAPATKIEHPDKGGGYKRKSKFNKDHEHN